MAARRTLIAVLLLVASAHGAAQLPAATAYEFPKRISTESRTTLEQLADSAHQAGLPSDPLVAKAAEGVLKGADDARIVQAVRTLVRELGAARAALPPDSRPGTIVAGASALHVGVPPAALRRLWIAGNARPSEGDLAVALVTLADLVTSRVAPEAAATSVQLLLSRRATDAEMSAFRAAVARAISAGSAPDAAIADRTQSLVQQIDARVRDTGRSPAVKRSVPPAGPGDQPPAVPPVP
ncbi:MAG TPA: hypothetical protein VFT29_11785 [Gemmatimonadaceae bacterium]|nr:hypothetical protein [Gemmatimonadaceae bacterium]